jgi:hypothetical protein
MVAPIANLPDRARVGQLPSVNHENKKKVRILPPKFRAQWGQWQTAGAGNDDTAPK